MFDKGQKQSSALSCDSSYCLCENKGTDQLCNNYAPLFSLPGLCNRLTFIFFFLEFQASGLLRLCRQV